MPHRVALILSKEEIDLLALWEQTYRHLRADFQADVWEAAKTIVRIKLHEDPDLTMTLDSDSCPDSLRQLPIGFLVFSGFKPFLDYLERRPFPKVDAIVVDIGAIHEAQASGEAATDLVNRLATTKIGIKPRPVIGVGNLFRAQLTSAGCDPVCTMTELPTQLDRTLEPFKHQMPP